MQVRGGELGARDVSLLKKNEEKGNYKVRFYNSGSGTGPALVFNRNNPDDTKRELYKTPEFTRAISHGINRSRIKKMVFFDTGYETTGTYSPFTIEFQRTEEGKEIFKKLRDLAVEYDTEKAKNLLDSIDVKDQNDDGWREAPDGSELTLRIDMDAAWADTEWADTFELVIEDLEGIGLKTILNPREGAQLNSENTQASLDIWGFGASDGPDHLIYPHWLIGTERWAPLYGAWIETIGTDLEGTELDKDPRDRHPPRKEPEPGSPEAEIADLYKEAIVTPDSEDRDALVHEILKIHIKEGPFFIGTVANPKRVGIVSQKMSNVPTEEDLAQGGWIDATIMNYISVMHPEQFYFKE